MEKLYSKKIEIKPDYNYNNYKIEDCKTCKGNGSIDGINCNFCHKCNATGIIDNNYKVLFKRLQFLEKRYLAEWNICRIHNLTPEQIDKKTEAYYPNFNNGDKINVSNYDQIIADRNQYRKRSDGIIETITGGKWFNDIPQAAFADTMERCQHWYTEFQFAVFGKYLAEPIKQLIPIGFGILPFQLVDLWDYRCGNYNAQILQISFNEYQRLQKQFKKVNYTDTEWVTKHNKGNLETVYKSKYVSIQGDEIANHT